MGAEIYTLIGDYETTTKNYNYRLYGDKGRVELESYETTTKNHNNIYHG